MVELRWVFGSEPAPEIGENVERAVKVLQYRTKIPDSALGRMPADPRDRWTEWQDVTTVDEQAKGA